VDQVSPERPASPFLILGAGGRPKLIYRSGTLRDAASRRSVREWRIVSEKIQGDVPSVEMITEAGTQVSIVENANGIRITEDGKEEFLCREDGIRFPDFASHPYGRWLRQLHHEILVNIRDGQPLPNLLVYDKPWLRDSAMMAMCLEKTGNLGLIKDWILGLTDCYDRNNAGEEEPDNLGEALYLISLVSDADHPLVRRILDEAARRTVNGHLTGQSDFSEHPVYQTKWLKFGLRALGLDDRDWTVPVVYDAYSALFWWADTEQHVEGPGFASDDRKCYPYLGWAEDHFYKRPPAFDLLGKTAPITWEANASQANYENVTVAGEDPSIRCSYSHTWHAAEAFLYLLELH
jgi:hypothetical protein